MKTFVALGADFVVLECTFQDNELGKQGLASFNKVLAAMPPQRRSRWTPHPVEDSRGEGEGRENDGEPPFDSWSRGPRKRGPERPRRHRKTACLALELPNVLAVAVFAPLSFGKASTSRRIDRPTSAMTRAWATRGGSMTVNV